jgi:hypothetical protein
LGSTPTLTLLFTWVDAFQPKKRCSSSSTRLEKAGVLFNIAACLGCRAHYRVLSEPLTESALREAVQDFQHAAGYYALLQFLNLEGLGMELTPDLQHSSLKALELAMLGNAQLCAIDLATMGEMSASTVSRVAAGAAELFSRALESALRRYFPPSFVAELELLRDYARAQAMQYAAMELDANGTGNLKELMGLREADLLERVRRYDEAAYVAESLLRNETLIQDTLLCRRLETISRRCRTGRARCERENAVVFQIECRQTSANGVHRRSAPQALPFNILAATPDPKDLASALGDGTEKEHEAALRPVQFLPKDSPLLTFATIIPHELGAVADRYMHEAKALVERAVARLREANHLSATLRQELNTNTILASIPAKPADVRESETPEKLSPGLVAKFRTLLAELSTGNGIDSVSEELIRQITAKLDHVEHRLEAEAAEDASWRIRVAKHAYRPESAEAQQPYTAALEYIKIELKACQAAARGLQGRVQQCHNSSVRDAMAVLKAHSQERKDTALEQLDENSDNHSSSLICRDHPAASQLSYAAAKLLDLEKRRETLARELEQRYASDEFGHVLLDDHLPVDLAQAHPTQLVQKVIEHRYASLVCQAEDLLGSVASSARAELQRAVDDLQQLHAERDRELANAADKAGRVHRAIEDMQTLVQETNHLRGRCARLLEKTESLAADVDGFCEARRLEVALDMP